MHKLIVTVVTNIDRIVIALIAGATPVINMIARIGVVNLLHVIATSKTIMLMIVNVFVCTLTLILVPQAILAASQIH